MTKVVEVYCIAMVRDARGEGWFIIGVCVNCLLLKSQSHCSITR